MRLQSRTWGVFLVLMTISIDAGVASAASLRKTPILVLESYTGERPKEIAPLIATLDDELEKRGFAARPSTILGVAAGLPRPGILDKSMTAAQLAQQVEGGYDLFVKGNYRGAVATLQRAIGAIQRNPAIVVLNTSNADVVLKAYATLALSQAKVGDPDASLTMTQVIRMFPTRPFPRDDYGPDDEKFYRKVYKQVQAMGRGRLVVKAGNRQAVIFVDGQIRGVDKIGLADLIPGTYRVFVQVPGTPGRQYELEVTASDDSFLEVEPEIDSTLWATDSWIGFQFASNAARGKEAKFAGALASKWSGRDLVAVVGTTRLSGRLVLIGTIYTTDGTMLRSAALDIETATPTLLQSLARLMAEGGPPPDGIRVIGETRIASADQAEGTKRSSWWSRPTLYLIGGATLLVASAVAYAGTPADDFTKPTYADYRTPAVGGFVGGSAVLGSGIYLWLRDEKSSDVLTAAAIGGGIAATLSGVMLYATSEDLHSQGYQRPTYRDTTGTGIVLGTAGVLAIGTGLVVLRRASRARVVPVASVSQHHGFVSFVGTL